MLPKIVLENKYLLHFIYISCIEMQENKSKNVLHFNARNLHVILNVNR